MKREETGTGRSGAGAMEGGFSGDPSDAPERVVVVGGGYAGLFAAKRASGGARRGRVEVTLVDPAPEWVERTRLHQVAAGDGSVSRYPLAELFRGTGVSVVGGRATEIDPEGGEVAVETGSGTTVRLPFDRLVYALGSTADTGLVAGARDHAFVLDSTSTAEDLRRALDAAAASSSPPGGRVAVVGGGLSGVEAATEIAETYPGLSVALVTAGEIGGGNVARDLAGKPTKPLRFGYLQQAVSLGRRDGLVQLTDGNDGPFGWVVTGRMAARIKESVERFVVVGSLRLERLLPGAYAWRPAPRVRGGSAGNA